MCYRKIYHLLSIPLVIGAILLKAQPAPGGDFSSLQKDFREYRGSDYMNRNTARKESRVGTGVNKEEALTVVQRDLKALKEELASRKADKEKALKLIIIENRLFEPEPGLLTRVKEAEDAGDIEGLLREDYTLKTILTVGITNNPDIRSAYGTALSTLERYDQVSNLDEILGQYAVFTKNLDINVGKNLHNKPVIMNFPFPGMLSLKGDIVDKEVRIAGLKLAGTVQDVITEIRQTYYETLYLYHAVDITREVLELLYRLKEVINTVYTTGRASLNDVVKIQMEIDRIENDLLVLEEQNRTTQVKLNKLLNIDTGFEPYRVEGLSPVKLDYLRDELFKKGQIERTEIKTLAADLERMGLAITIAEKRFYPDFTPGYSLFQSRVIKQVGTDAPAEGFSTRPTVRGLNWFGSNDAYIRETKVKLKAMQDSLSELKNSTVNEISQALFGYENAERSSVLYGSKLVPKSRLTIDVTETQYITGKVDFMDLIDSQEMFLRYSLLLKKSIMDMNVEAARLERLVGFSVEKK